MAADFVRLPRGGAAAASRVGVCVCVCAAVERDRQGASESGSRHGERSTHRLGSSSVSADRETNAADE